MKQIAYLLTNYGVDGLAKKEVDFAFLDEKERDTFFEASKNKNWLIKEEIIVDLEKVKKETLARLDGLEKLVLGIENKSWHFRIKNLS